MTNYESMFLNCPDSVVSTSPYYVNIKKMLEAGAKIHSYQSIVDLSLEELDKLNPDDIVNIRYNNSLDGFANIGDFHRVSDMKKILLTCQKLLSDIDLNQPEEDIFMQIYIKLGLLLHYDESDCSSAYNMRALLNKNGVCLGITMALKALLDMAHIESNIVFTAYKPTSDHAFLQVKLNGKWYYCDLTWDLDNIKNGTIKCCLLSEESIQTSEGAHQVFNLTDKHEALEDYPNVLELLKRNYEKIMNKSNNTGKTK
jgi:transglutaminase/protease-like cytokinesis protein 3